MTLVEFLRARLDEDERTAREIQHLIDHRIEDVSYYSPARVLAEVAAKRRIMRLHDVLGGSLTGVGRWTYCETCHTNSAGQIDKDVTEATAPCATLRLLALPYADHPDYDPAWRV